MKELLNKYRTNLVVLLFNTSKEKKLIREEVTETKTYDHIETRLGRMNTETILSDLVPVNLENVGVFVCGSSKFMNELESSSDQFKNVVFYRETYEF
jgi:hypothetical protein